MTNPSQKKVTTKALNKTVPKATGSLRETRLLQSKAVTGIVTAIGMTKNRIFSITHNCDLKAGKAVSALLLQLKHGLKNDWARNTTSGFVVLGRHPRIAVCDGLITCRPKRNLGIN
jgi:hypothetical protein